MWNVQEILMRETQKIGFFANWGQTENTTTIYRVRKHVTNWHLHKMFNSTHYKNRHSGLKSLLFWTYSKELTTHFIKCQIEKFLFLSFVSKKIVKELHFWYLSLFVKSRFCNFSSHPPFMCIFLYNNKDPVFYITGQ